MKNIICLRIVIVFLFLFSLSSRNLAQTELWSTAPMGGDNGSGAIFKIKSDGTDYQTKYNFPIASIDGAVPKYTVLCSGNNGKLYGITSAGGLYLKGIIFSLDTVTNVFTNLHSFSGGTDGGQPYGSLVRASNGKLYGTTLNGGTNNNGTIFVLDPANNSYLKLYDFTSTGGYQSYGEMLQAGNGKLYGLTRLGGSLNGGTLFSFEIGTNTYVKLLDFTGTANGLSPNGSLIQALNGKLYGMTSFGGVNSAGTIFSYDIGTSTYSKRFDFNTTTTGRYPYGKLVQSASGLFYGINPIGGANADGVFFSFDDAALTYTVLHDFNTSSATDGGEPYCSLILASDGKFYGTTSKGAPYGTLFSITTGGVFTKLASFDYANNGYAPLGGVIQVVPGGKLYGMASDGGIGYGTAYKYTISSATFSKLTDFYNITNGSFPTGSLFKASNGLLYGMAQLGGINGDGVLFSYSQTTNTYTKLFDFVNGGPMGSVMQATDGKLYGLTKGGGTNGQGTLFSYDIGASTLTNLVNFSSGANGRIPQGSLIQAANGKLYGMTGYGGAAGDFGVLFSYNIATSTFTKHIDFAGVTNGQRPYGSLLQASNGKLYGMNFIGGASSMGILFSFDTLTNTLTKILDFSGSTNGGQPQGSLIQAANGLLYGLTGLGGDNGTGVIFSLDPATNTYTKIYNFQSLSGNTLGCDPLGSLFQSVNGKLYGMTNAGGLFSHGVLFSFDITTNTYAKMRDLNYNDGIEPYFESFIELGIGLSTGTITTNICAGSALSVPFTVSSSLNAGNVFTAQLSDASGSFASPVNIGTTTSVVSGNISCIIPSGTASGSGYRIRVVSSLPALTGTDNGTNISIGPFKYNLFNESMGIVAANTAIATHESANGFDNDAFTMSGNTEISIGNPSFGYTESTGSANVFFSNINGKTFQISGINTTGLTGLELRFGIFKSNTISITDLIVVEVSTDGIAYTPLSYSLPTGIGTATWFYRTPAGIIPSTANLRIRFTQNAFIPSNQYRIDDIKLVATNSTPGIAVNGTTYICNSNSVDLLASSAVSYLWSNSSTTNEIFVNTAGSFSCTMTSETGCPFLSNTINVTDATPSVFNVTGGGSYCSTGSGVSVDLSGSQTGVNYQLMRNGVTTVGSPVIGTGAAIPFGNQTVAGNYSVVATTASTACNRIMEDTMVVSIIPATTYYADVDHDTYGNPSSSTLACSLPVGYVSNNLDCNDNSASVHPGAVEIPGDGIDQDCNGGELCYTDVDDDNYGTSVTIASANMVCTDLNEASVNGDCNDNVSTIHPGAIEIPGDGIDQDCNGGELCFTDVDDDNYGTSVTITSANMVCTDLNEAAIIGDCNDNVASIHPGAVEIPGDGIDQDCNGAELCYTDIDDDNYGTSVTIASANMVCTDLNEASVNGDCNDNVGSIYPGAVEIPGDGIDQDCNGGELCYTDVDDDNYGTSATIASPNLVCTDLNEASVSGDCNDNSIAVNPGASEICCNLIDDNCNGLIDEGCPLNGIYCIGPSASYSPPAGPAYANANNPYDQLKDAIIALNSFGACGNVIFEFQNNYTDAGEVYPISITYHGTSSATAVFRPRSDIVTPLVISGNASSNDIMLEFNGADYVTFDGSAGGVNGTVSKIILRNLYTFGLSQSNILFENDATHNTINALSIEGGFGANSCIQIDGTTGSIGNDFNTIQNCLISDRTDILTIPPYNAIVSAGAGSGNSANSSIVINGNKINNIPHGVLCNSSASNGVWNITNNHFYFSRQGSGYTLGNPIYFITPDTATIVVSGNYIGGSAPNASGLPASSPDAFSFNGIIVSINNSSNSATISNNVIKNYFGTGAANYSFYGITVNGGPANITNNVIGDPAVSNSIWFGSNSDVAFGGITVNSSQNFKKVNVANNSIGNIAFLNNSGTYNSFTGIGYNSALNTDTTFISNNYIHDISSNSPGVINFITVSGGTVSPALTSVTGNIIEAINISNSASSEVKGISVLTAPANVSGNRIGRFSVTGDIIVTRKGANYGYYISPNISSGGAVVFDHDTIANTTINQPDISSVFTGIYINTGNSILDTLKNNVVKNLITVSTKSNVETDSPANLALTGIFLGAVGSGHFLKNNVITGLHANTTSAVQPFVSGISLLTGNVNVIANHISDLTNSAINSVVFPFIYGINVPSGSTGTFSNNMISINNNGVNNGLNIYGIVSNESNTFYYNSVALSGSSAIGGRTAAIWHKGSIAGITLRNNVFYNSRSGSGQHYAIGNESGTVNFNSSSSDYNDLYSANPATLGAWPIGTSLSYNQWKSISGGDVNSKNSTVSFINITNNLHLNTTGNCALEGKATTVSVSVDYDNDSRSLTTPDIGADEFTGAVEVAAAGSITGSVVVCQGQNGVVYSVSAIAGASSYVWILPAGCTIVSGVNTNSITVNYSTTALSGNISVNGIAGECTGAASTSAVIVNRLPSHISNQVIVHSGVTSVTNSSTAAPYPSTINVSGLFGNISDVNVNINGLSHTFPDDIDLLLESPSGQRLLLISDCGGGNIISNENITLNDSALSFLTDASLISSGTFKPTNFQSPDNIPSPGPGSFTAAIGTLSAGLNIFNGFNPNGTWKLFFADDFSPSGNGSIASWSLEITLQGDTPVVAGSAVVCKGQTDVLYSIPAWSFATGYNWSLPSGASIVSGANTNSVLVNYSLSATSGNVFVTPFNSCGNGLTSFLKPVTVNNCSLVTLNLKLFIEGFYTGGGLMNNGGLGGCLYINGVSANPLDADTVTVCVMDALTHAEVEKQKVLLHTNGTLSVSLGNSVVAGTAYFIKVTHRNAVETWSSSAILFNTSTSYDFTTAASQAYGNNQVQVFDALGFAFYSGDISDAGTATVGIQDGIVESQDYGDIENAVYSVLSGYRFEDITGDGIVESSDYSLMENNLYYVVVTMIP